VRLRVAVLAPPRQFFQASCDVAREARVRTLLTAVDGDGATYRMFDRLLERVVHARSSETLRRIRAVCADAVDILPHTATGRTASSLRN
jgi:hypothetical protein